MHILQFCIIHKFIKSQTKLGHNCCRLYTFNFGIIGSSNAWHPQSNSRPRAIRIVKAGPSGRSHTKHIESHGDNHNHQTIAGVAPKSYSMRRNIGAIHFQLQIKFEVLACGWFPVLFSWKWPVALDGCRVFQWQQSHLNQAAITWCVSWTYARVISDIVPPRWLKLL